VFIILFVAVIYGVAHEHVYTARLCVNNLINRSHKVLLTSYFLLLTPYSILLTSIPLPELTHPAWIAFKITYFCRTDSLFLKMHILIIDNYDSFTYNLYHLVEAVMRPECKLTVCRNDAINISDAARYDKIIVSPGPGLPKDAGISCEIIRRYAAEKSILGVCLGHQAIAEVFGGKLLNLPQVLHGKAINTIVTDKKEPLFFRCPEQFDTGRYHSWVIDPDTIPADLKVTAKDEMGLIMAVRHSEYDVKGVQFHPESVMTAVGRQILSNWINA